VAPPSLAVSITITGAIGRAEVEDLDGKTMTSHRETGIHQSTSGRSGR
jgi:hypothetical protein